jgi:hypothetical protein
MTLIYPVKNQPDKSLTVFPEAVRGLRFDHPHWRLFVSDPEPMAVSIFRLPAKTLSDAGYAIQRCHPHEVKTLKPEEGKILLDWLLSEHCVRVEIEESTGMPSMFPPGKFAGAKPDLGMPPPQIVK